MKKLLVAASLAVVSMAASADVTLYGQMRTFVDNTSTGGAGAVRSIVNDSSRLGVAVTEDLGKGLKARAILETSVASDDPKTGSNTQLGDRHSTVGLASGLGSIDLGRREHSQYLALKAGDPFGGAVYGSIVEDVHNTRGKRLGDATFLTVTPVSNVGINYDRNQSPTTANGIAWSVGGKLGPVNAAIARYEQGVEVSDVLVGTTKIGASTLYYSHSDNKSATASANMKGDSLGVKHSFGAVSVLAGYGRTNTDIKAKNIGVEYAFSKSTNVLLAVRNVDQPGSASDIKQYGAGLRLTF